MATIVESTIGVTGDYSSINNWVVGQVGDFVSNNQIQKGILIDASLSITSIQFIEGATTDEDHYWWLTVDENERHTGKAGTGNKLVSNYSDNYLIFTHNNCLINYIEFDMNSNGFRAIRMRGEDDEEIYWTVTVSHCIFYDGLEETEEGSILYSINLRKSKIYNNLIHNFQSDVGNMTAINAGSAIPDETLICNNTISNLNSDAGYTRGISYGTTSNLDEITNNIVVNLTSLGSIKCYYILFAEIGPSNISGDDTATGDNSFINETASNLFKDHANNDYSLKLSSVAKDAGYDLSTYFTDDIAGNSRPFGEYWDIGCLEFLAVSGRIKITEMDTKNLLKIDVYVVDFLGK